MKYNVEIRSAATPASSYTEAGVDGVYLVNPQTHGEPFALYERAAAEDGELDGQLLVINTNEIISARITSWPNV